MKKSLIVGFVFLMAATSVYADGLDPLVSAQKEEGLEADHDTMQIKDLEAEQKNAKEQALLQEKISRDAKARLEAVQLKKQETLAKAHEEIKLYEARRKEAEKSSKASNAEINKLSTQIKKLEDSIANSKQAAKDAEDISKAGQEELKIVQDQKAKLDNENRQALYIQAQNDAEVSRLRAEYAQASQSLKDLEQRLQMNQSEAKKKMALKAQLSHELALVQSKQAAARAALGIHTPAVANSARVPQTVTPTTQKEVTAADLDAPSAPAEPAAPAATAQAPSQALGAPSVSTSEPPSASAVKPATATTNVAMMHKTRSYRSAAGIMSPTQAAQAAMSPRSESLPASPEVQTIMKDGRTCDVDRDDRCQ